MRRQRGHRGGLSLGTVVMLLLTGLVIGGCVMLFPKLVGNIELRVNPQQMGVAINSAVRGLGSGQNAQPEGAPGATPATAPPLDMATIMPTATQAVTRNLTLTAGGSIKIDTQIQKACTGAEGYTFAPLLEQLADSNQSELNLATLENLTVSNEKLTDVNMPVDALAALARAGINVVCNGFYGVLNNGLSGLSTTLAAITQNGMTPYGVYTSKENRSHVVTMQTEEVTVALLSYQGELSAAGKKRATAQEQGYAIAPLTLPTITQDISAARAVGAQVIIVSLCWGKEGATQPNATQMELAQGIANAGADIILGTHSGTLQPIALLTANRADGTKHQTLCAYSLGNILESDRSDRGTISSA